MRSLGQLHRRPAYALASITTMALAVGANLVVFTFVNALWLRPRAITDPDRVVVIARDFDTLDGSRYSETALDRFRQIQSFDGVAGQAVTAGMFARLRPRVTIPGTGRAIETAGVTPDYFAVLGVRVRGREFQALDGAHVSPAPAVISDRLWRSVFHGRPDILGLVVPAAPVNLEVVGVAAAGFRGARLGERVDLWLPHAVLPRIMTTIEAGAPPPTLPLVAIARLRAGASIDRARSELAQGPRGVPALAPIADVFGAADLPMVLVRNGDVMAIAAITAGFVLAGGCAALIALALVHYEQRRTELAIRTALGAARARLVMMLAAELAWLAVLGTLGALAVARTTIAVLPRFSLPGGIDLARVDLTLDWRVALVALAGCLGAMAAGTILPIVRFTRPGIARGVLAAAATLSRASMRLRATILALHVGATAVVLCASALFVQNIVQALASGPGFDTDHVLFAAVQATPHRVGQAPAATARAARDVSAGLAALRQIESLPGVEMVAVAAPPIGLRQEENLRGTTSPRNATGLKQVEADGTAYDLSFGFLLVGPGYLEAIGAPILAGRAALHDEVVLTPALARDLWGEENPLGRLFAFGGLTGTVSGVTDMAFGSIRRGRPPAAFLVSDDRAAAAVLASTGDLPLVIKARDPDTLRAPVERILSTTFPESPVLSVATARDLVATDLGRERMTAWMFSGFGLVALALAVESTFGLVAYLVAARRREFGVRMTLGATRADLVGRAVWASLAPATVGAACGLGAAVILAGSARAYLFGVSTVDVPAYAGVFLLILAGTAIAAGLAARRIRDVSPLDSLRAE